MDREEPDSEASALASTQAGAAGGKDDPAASASAQSFMLPERSKTDPALDPLVGTILAGRYEVLRRIGEGGMGAVYEARHTVIGKRVAVKVLLERLVEKRELVARLLKEARLASAIGHENIVDVTDFGTTEDARSFVVMEYLEGEPLSALLAREAPLPVERCLHIVRQVASALDAAHAKGIVHRDIKPENIYLIRRGEEDFVKVVDFGVSKAVRTADEGPDTLRLTRTGMLLGTPLYMSPEQARGEEDIDHRADVWAVGIVLYECLTGEVPFRANNYLQVIAQVLNHEALPPSKMLPELGIPVAVEAVVMKALEKDRQQRYQRMDALRQDVERLINGDSNVARDDVMAPMPAEAGRIAPRWHLVIVSVLVLGVGLAVSLAQSRDPEDEVRVRVPEQAANPGQEATMNATPAPPAVSPPVSLEPSVGEALPAPRELPFDRAVVTSPPRMRRAGATKNSLPVRATAGQEEGPSTPGQNIRYIGDDVAPSSEKIFGRKPIPDAGRIGGAR